jgi:hypothetical protein
MTSAGAISWPAAHRQRRALGAAGRGDVHEREVAVLVLGDGHSEAIREGKCAQRRGQVAHRADLAVEHHLQRVFGERPCQRRRFPDERAVPGEVAAAVRMRPVHPLVDDLPFVGRGGFAGRGAVEDERHAVLEAGRGGQDVARRLARQRVPVEERAAAVPHHRAVVHDESERQPQGLGQRAREMEAAAGDERNRNARGRGLPQRGEVRLGNLPPAVEEGPVDIDGQQADHG